MTEKQVQTLKKKFPECMGKCKILNTNSSNNILIFKTHDIIYKFDNLSKANKFLKDQNKRENTKTSDNKLVRELNKIEKGYHLVPSKYITAGRIIGFKHSDGSLENFTREEASSLLKRLKEETNV